MSLYSEILEQPACLERMLRSQRANVEDISRIIKAHDISYVFLAARGTSDNAGRYANYLFGAQNHLPLALAAPSLFTYYERPPRLKNALVMGISQSGQSPDIVSVLHEAKRQGCPTLAITNVPNSPLGAEADLVFDLQAGPELAVAATKTYSAELMAIAMISAAIEGQRSGWNLLEKVPQWAAAALQQDEQIRKNISRYQPLQKCAVLGRGYNYATAFEWALKLKELTYLEAEPYSTADFQHGPIAIVGRGYPILAIVAAGQVAESMLELLDQLKKDLQAELVVITNVTKAAALARMHFSIPADIPEALSPLVSIIPAQLFVYHLSLAKGLDPDQPRTINKITETR